VSVLHKQRRHRCYREKIARILGESGVIFVDLRFLPSLINATCRGNGLIGELLTFRRASKCAVGQSSRFPGGRGRPPLYRFEGTGCTHNWVRMASQLTVRVWT
jgi:hypothetical protein